MVCLSSEYLMDIIPPWNLHIFKMSWSLVNLYACCTDFVTFKSTRKKFPSRNFFSGVTSQLSELVFIDMYSVFFVFFLHIRSFGLLFHRRHTQQFIGINSSVWDMETLIFDTSSVSLYYAIYFWNFHRKRDRCVIHFVTSAKVFVKVGLLNINFTLNQTKPFNILHVQRRCKFSSEAV